MTSVATGNIAFSPQFVFSYQVQSKGVLVCERLPVDREWTICRRLFVSHVENLVARSQVFFRSPVAIETPLHLQRCVVVHQRHSIDGTVTGIASHTFVDVNTVVKVNEIRKIVDPCPNQRFVSTKTFPHRLQHRGLRPYLRMTIDAGFGGWNPGETRLLHRCMTVSTVDPQTSYMVLMAEGYWLRSDHPSVSGVGRSLHLCHCPKQRRYDEYSTKNRGAGYCVGTTVKDLGHRSAFNEVTISRTSVQAMGLLSSHNQR